MRGVRSHGVLDALLAITLHGCADRYLSLGLDSPNALLLVATAGGEGDVLEVDRIGPGFGRSVFATPEGAESVHLYPINVEDLVGADGEPLDPVVLESLGVRRASDAPPDAGCGRCPVPSLSPPLVVLPGSGCGLPRWVVGKSYSLDGRVLDDPHSRAVEAKVRSQVTLDWPGSCSCAARLGAGLGRPLGSACLVHPDSGARISAVNLDAFGTVVGLIGPSLYVSPRGEPPETLMGSGADVAELGIVGSSTRSRAFTIVQALKEIGSGSSMSRRARSSKRPSSLSADAPFGTSRSGGPGPSCS
ncbi:MAG: hypothetical protein HYV07_10185 [Deltaproteobacteria bacterium]|nr:hypothetical protein [Deltaproteobacteria bacterium]